MASLQTETMIHGLIRRIVMACEERGTHISNPLAAAVMKGVVLHPDTGLDADRELSRDDVQRVVERSVVVLSGNDVAVQTVSTQVLFQSHYRSIDDLLRARQREMDDVMKEVEDTILSARCKSRPEFEALYRQIVSCMLLRSNMGSPTDINVVKETTAALESVMPPEELGTFVALSRVSKRQQLHEMSLITMGIRLFNRACGKGGQAIPDLPSEVEGLLASTTETLQQHLRVLIASAYAYAERLLAAGGEAEGEEHTTTQHLSANAWQHIVYLEQLQRDVSRVAEEYVRCRRQFHLRKDRLFATIGQSTAVPTDQVYPQFVEMGSLWQAMQGQLAVVSAAAEVLSHIVSDLDLHTTRDLPDSEDKSPLLDAFAATQHTFQNMCETTLSELKSNENQEGGEGEHDRTVDDAPPRDVAERPLRASELQSAHPLIKLLEPLTTHNFENLPLHCHGFCPVTFVDSGAVVPVCRHIGLLQFGNAFYGFLSRDAALKFAADPESMVTRVLDTARRRIEAPELLRLHTALAARQDVSAISQGGQKMAVKCDAGSQTETHPVTEHIDKKYEWNEWELRRKALKLANLRQKKTHSTQTQNSHFRRENTTQVYLPKSNTTQTKKDSYTNTSKPVTYMRGLRGPRGPKAIPQQNVDLTLDIGGIALEPKPLQHIPARVPKPPPSRS